MISSDMTSSVPIGSMWASNMSINNLLKGEIFTVLDVIPHVVTVVVLCAEGVTKQFNISYFDDEVWPEPVFKRIA
jgi:hypothetical protein